MAPGYVACRGGSQAGHVRPALAVLAADTDPRPRIVTDGEIARVAGMRCQSCGHPLAFARPLCPVCGGPVSESLFGPYGTVFASTVIRIPVGDRRPPYGLAYVDLDDGPRLLAGTLDPSDGTELAAVPVGTRVALTGSNDSGDPVVTVCP